MAAHSRKLRVPRGADFVLRHYAGDVAYTADGFCAANKDEGLLEALRAMCGASSLPFVRELARPPEGAAAPRPRGKFALAQA
jgi:myosin heavy subunit